MRALGKVVQVMPPRLRRRVDALASYTVPAVFTSGGDGPTIDADVLATLAQACRDDERVRLRLPHPRRRGDGALRRAAPAGVGRAAAGTSSAGTSPGTTGAASGSTG